MATIIDESLLKIGSVYDGILDDLNRISNANFGDEVRLSIVSALKNISEKIDFELNKMNYIVNAASEAVKTNASQYSRYSAMATEASQITTALANAKTAIDTQLEKITNITTERVKYVAVNNGASTEWGFRDDYPRLEHRGAGTGDDKWIFHLPQVPNFKTITIKRLNFRTITGLTDTEKLQKFKSSVNYDPNAGNLTITVPDPLSALSVATVVKPEAYNGTTIPADLRYDSTGKIPTITLYVPHGPKGEASYRLNYRPYFQTEIWKNNANMADNSKTTFPEQVVLGGSVHATQNGKFYAGGYSLHSGAIPAIDAILVRFRKSVNNASTADNGTLSGSFGAGLTFKNNSDYDDIYTAVIPRGCNETISIVDQAGRKITRPVYWLDGTEYCRGIWNGGKSTMPSWKFGRRSDIQAILDSQTGTRKDNKTILYSYSWGLYIGNAKVDGNGDLTEYAYWGETNVNTDFRRTKRPVKDYLNPVPNQDKNQAYNQFLIPISIDGIWYKMPESYIFTFPGNNA